MVAFDNYDGKSYSINDGHGQIIGATSVMVNLFHYFNRLASLPTTVLLRGKTGTGKELAAKSLHYNGTTDRRNHNFVSVNCAGIPHELLESELFGYRKGAFTGAYADTPGKFQHADRGTLFLDEIGEMEASLQAKILRAIQDRQVTRVGGTSPENVDVRIVAATNKDLEKEVQRGHFRQDLYYRLNVLPLTMPALMERAEDIPLIADYFIGQFNDRYMAQIGGFTDGGIDKLKAYDWSGNVRELENIIERVFVFKKDGEIGSSDISFGIDIPEMTQALPIADSSRNGITILPGREKKWYESGVLPISASGLQRFDGTVCTQTIKFNFLSEIAYSFTLGRGQRKYWFGFLTPDNAASFFSDTSTRDYEELMQKITEGSFNEAVSSPIAFFSMDDLLAVDTLKARRATLQKKVARHAVYTLRSTKHAYALDAPAVSHLFMDGEEYLQDQLKEIISERFRQFREWVPASR
jgi:DNA-binding NtrC family response regulator